MRTFHSSRDSPFSKGSPEGPQTKDGLWLDVRQHVFLLLFVVGLFIVGINSGASRWLSAKHQPRTPVLTSMLFTPLVSEGRSTLASSCLYGIICKYNYIYMYKTWCVYIKHCTSIFYFLLSKTDLQCCIIFKCAKKWFGLHIYVYTHTHTYTYRLPWWLNR